MLIISTSSYLDHLLLTKFILTQYVSENCMIISKKLIISILTFNLLAKSHVNFGANSLKLNTIQSK
jgi:hypothetical protein